MTDRLVTGLLHLDVRHEQVAENRSALVGHAEEAARLGAKLIVAPELAVSGYSFDSREAVAPYSETLAEVTDGELAKVARRYGVYICTGFAERDPVTGVYYNSACVIGPSGQPVAHHRKIIPAERRWACPGSPSPSSIFDTPWGRLGVLICADVYFGLIPRSFVLHGVDVLINLANWPPSGIDPRRVWRARALENGVGVIACNRTGIDRWMDCRGCSSYAVTADGEVLLDGSSESSCVWMVQYPLENGRFPTKHRLELMAKRRVEDFTALYLHVDGIDDFTGLWGLPESGELNVQCLIPESADLALPTVQAATADSDHKPTLLVLPRGTPAIPVSSLKQVLANSNTAVISEMEGLNDDETGYGLISSTQCAILSADKSALTVDFGPARIGLAQGEMLRHPELAVALSKQGCDLVVTGEKEIDEDQLLLFGVKCLEQTIIVTAAQNKAAIYEPPVGHGPWKEASVRGPGTCRTCVNTASVRKKRFHDRVDLEVLLRR